jgi:hypothetical protein
MMTKITVTFALIFCLNHQSAHAQLGVYKVHSLFIYNFTKHILWKDVDESFTIGVYGSEIALNVMKENLTGKRYFGKEIRVIRVEKISDANQSQLVYMPKSDKAKILNIFEGANKNNVLFVSEDDLIDQGFPISFVLNGTKHRFKVSKKNLEASGLKISTSLLSLAEVVD